MTRYRLEWINLELTEVRLSKGYFWWRRCALVVRVEEPSPHWRFQYSDFECAPEICLFLERDRARIIAYGHDELDWRKVSSGSRGWRRGILRLLP